MTEVLAPCAGVVVPMTEVPDQVFATEMVGPGVAIDPGKDPVTVVAPLSGRILKLHPHAFVVLGGDGVGVLVHLGIDTVQMDGRGFELLASEGADVAAGEPVVRWEPQTALDEGKSTLVPVVAMDRAKGSVATPDPHRVAAGDLLFGVT